MVEAEVPKQKGPQKWRKNRSQGKISMWLITGRFVSHRLDSIQKYTQSKKIEGYKYMALVFDELEDSYIGKTVSDCCCSDAILMLLAINMTK